MGSNKQLPFLIYSQQIGTEMADRSIMGKKKSQGAMGQKKIFTLKNIPHH